MLRSPSPINTPWSLPRGGFIHAVKIKLAVALNRCGIDTVDLSPERTDTPRSQRIKIANDSNADICVSIHYNAFDGKFDTNKGGLCIFHYPNSGQGKMLAERTRVV